MFGILIDAQGYKLDFLVIGEYEFKEGEQVIEKDWDIANSMIKPKWDFDNEVWIEAATEEEIEASKPPQIDNCPPKTLEQRLEEAEQKLAESEEEKKLLKAQVEANASSYEFLESCVMEMAGKVYA